jgi:hypothetical protein
MENRGDNPNSSQSETSIPSGYQSRFGRRVTRKGITISEADLNQAHPRFHTINADVKKPLPYQRLSAWRILEARASRTRSDLFFSAAV